MDGSLREVRGRKRAASLRHSNLNQAVPTLDGGSKMTAIETPGIAVSSAVVWQSASR